MKRTLYIRITLSSVFLAVVFLFNGCSIFEPIGHAISQGYENSISYFNGYYNAKWLFDEAEDELREDALTKRGKESTTPAADRIPPSIKEKFTKVIDKCSNILAFHSTSTLVDDALMLIGKSFYYQAEYLKAERKFSELLTQYPNSPLVQEAQLWYAETEEKLEKTDAAVRICESVITAAKTTDDVDVEVQAHKILGRIFFQQKQIDKAVMEFGKEIELSDDDDIKAEAQINLGNIYFSEEQYDKAAETFLKVSDYTSDPYSNYYSTMQAAVTYRKIKEYEKGLVLLNEMIEDFRYQTYLPNLLFERANNNAANGNMSEAIDEYFYVDTTYVNTECAQRSAYRLGVIYEKEIGDYKLAMKYYKEAMSAALPKIAADGRLKSVAFTGYFNSRERLKNADSLLFVLTDTTKETASDTLYADSAGVNTPPAEVSDEDTFTAEESGTIGRGTRRIFSRRASQAADSPLLDSDSTKRKIDTVALEKTRTIFDSLKTIRSLLDSAKYAVEQASSPQSYIDADSLAVLKFIADSIQRDISHIVDQVTDSLYVIKAIAAQDIGDIFYTELTVPDSALFWYEKSLTWSYDSYRSPRILYILAELSRKNIGKNYKTLEEYYVRLNRDFPESIYAKEAQRLLGKVSSEKKADTAAIYYEQAEKQIDAKQYDNAIKTLRSIVQSYPRSPYTAKSEYAIGWIFENSLKRPVKAAAQYKHVVKNYSGTEYARAAKKRSNVLKQYDELKQDTAKNFNVKVKTSEVQKTAVDTTKNKAVEIDTVKTDTVKMDTIKIEKSDTSGLKTLGIDTSGAKIIKTDSSGINSGPMDKKVPDSVEAGKDTVVSGKKLVN